MYTDMVGFTALGQWNESLALSVMEEQRRLVRPTLLRHGGREVKTMGDAFLVEFASALDAVRCAYDVQRTVREYNLSMPEEKKVHLRVGVHLGDVVESGGDISGDAVNVASRVQPLAEDGGVCITRQVYDQVHNKTEFPIETIGLKSVKNVSAPLEVFGVVMPWEGRNSGKPPLDSKRVGVLPFLNMSPDPNDSYFADGVTEEIITSLSGVSGLSVISRTSVMGYKGSNKNVREIGRELEVGSVLEGSFRKAGSRIRVTTQLIDVNSDKHVWAQNYDRELSDVFGVQSEIAEKVCEVLRVKLLKEEILQIEKAPTPNTEAYTLYLKGRQLLNEGTDASLRHGLELLSSATKVDPNFARAYVSVGECYAYLGMKSFISFDEARAGMRAGAKKALEIEPDLAEGHYLMGWTAWGEDQHELAMRETSRAIELNPNLSSAQSMMGVLQATNGHPKKAIELLEMADSLDPLRGSTMRLLGRMYIYTGSEKAVPFLDKNQQLNPFIVGQLRVVYYMEQRDLEKAERELRNIEAEHPIDFDVKCLKGYVLALKGDRPGTQAVINLLRGKFAGGATLERNIGYMRYFLGDKEFFFESMDNSAREHVLDPMFLRYSPLVDEARQDPRYAEAMRKAGMDPDVKE
jgi:adenylate cyclase